MSLAWTLLSVAVACTYIIQRFRIGANLPPSAVAMLLGILVGAVLLVLPGPEELVFEGEFFFYALLPPVIFNAGFQLKKKSFIRNLFPILMFAVVGTIVTALVFGFGIFGLAEAGLVKRRNLGVNPIFDCLLYGALISATDPVATLTILQALSAPPQLYNLVFGESVLNDAIAIVLFKTISKYYTNNEHDAVNGWSASWIVLSKFVVVSLGSIVIGFGTAMLGAFILKRLKMRRLAGASATANGSAADQRGRISRAASGGMPSTDDHMNIVVYELAILIIFSSFAYCFSEVFGFSGIMSLFFAGVCHGHYSYYNISTEAQIASKTTFEVVSFLTETFIFVYLGLQLPTMRHAFDPGLIFGGIVMSVIARAVNIFPISAIINLSYRWNLCSLRQCARCCCMCCLPAAMRSLTTVRSRRSSFSSGGAPAAAIHDLSSTSAAAAAAVGASASGTNGTMTRTLIAKDGKPTSASARRERSNSMSGGGGKKTICMKTQLVMWACGLRGAIAYALAINLPDKALSMLRMHRRHPRAPDDGIGVPAIETATLIIIVFTTLFFGMTTGPLLRFLKLSSSDGEGAAGDGFDDDDDDGHGGVGSCSLERTESKELYDWWKGFDAQYIKVCDFPSVSTARVSLPFIIAVVPLFLSCEWYRAR